MRITNKDFSSYPTDITEVFWIECHNRPYVQIDIIEHLSDNHVDQTNWAISHQRRVKGYLQGLLLIFIIRNQRTPSRLDKIMEEAHPILSF